LSDAFVIPASLPLEVADKPTGHGFGVPAKATSVGIFRAFSNRTVFHLGLPGWPARRVLIVQKTRITAKI
jgi:hypothetical protein